MSFSEPEWEELYQVARRQAVDGIVYDAVCGNAALADSMPEGVATRWVVDVEDNEAGYRKMSAVIDAQRKAWEKKGIEAVLLKGHSVAALYPEPSHRRCGDVDWYFPVSGDFARANKVVRDNGLELKVDSDGDVSYTLSGVIVEHHKDGFRQDTLTDMVVMLEDHVLKHAMVMGVGLKQVCDVAVARAALASSSGVDSLDAALAYAGLAEWDRLLCAALRTMGLLPDPDVESGLGVPASDAELLVDLFMSDGNMGLDKKNRFSGFWKRVLLLARYAPRQLASRWFSLAWGRVFRLFRRNTIFVG